MSTTSPVKIGNMDTMMPGGFSMYWCPACGLAHDSVTVCPPLPLAQQKPFKCPVCDGVGVVQARGTISNAFSTEQCSGCNGTGIVWGPPNG